jgi:hypothetical protein
MGLAKLPQSGGENDSSQRLTVLLTALTYVALILAVGSTDRHIQIFTRSENTVRPNWYG